MYAIYAYIDPQNHPNVGIYAKHRVFELYTWDHLGISSLGFHGEEKS